MTQAIYSISPAWLSVDELFDLFSKHKKLVLSDEVIDQVKRSRTYLDKKMKDGGVYYGINTGFGALYNQIIPSDQLESLQVNLLRSHACGMGEEVPKSVVKMMLLTKIKALSLGYSGVSVDTLNQLIYLYNQDFLPVVYTQGSLGASGDLAPLAHLSLPLIGEGYVWKEGQVVSANTLISKPIQLKSKEGLALINGTQFMSSYGLCAYEHLVRLEEWAMAISALSLDAFYGNLDAFYVGVMDVRHHQGQKKVAARMLEYLQGSEIQQKAPKALQDPYSFRCIPQVHGACLDQLLAQKLVLENELNAVSDNPLIFAEEDKIISGGNFHGEPLAFSLELMGLVAAELASISERRVYKLISGQRDLPAFLVKTSGIHSGMMIPQYTAASIVSQNKQLATPAMVDSIDSSNGQEDHVSMGANSATKLWKMVENLEKVLAIELFVASTALSLRPYQTSQRLERIIQAYRAVVPVVSEDRFFHEDLIRSVAFLKETSPKDF